MKPDNTPQIVLSYIPPFLTETNATHTTALNYRKKTGLICNLSPFGGKLLLVNQQLKEGDLIKFSITQTCELDEIIITARVLWKKSNPILRHVEIGCQFVNPSKQLTLNIMQLIRLSSATDQRNHYHCKLFPL